MSTSSKLKKPRKKAIDRPFSPDILKRARSIAADYQVVMWFEDGEYYGRGVELPMTFNDGKTPDHCMANTRDAFVSTVAYMLEKGETPPPPASEGIRTEQVNLRLSAEEKLSLETAAKQGGYRGLSDYVRSVALAETHKI